MHTPVFSVVLPTHDRPRYLESAVRSVLLQSFPHFELIVVDDGSRAETADVVGSLAREDPRIVAMTSGESLGCNGARNLALDRARGEFVAFLDDDDLSPPDRLERSLNAFERFPQADLVTGAYRFIDAEGELQPWAAPELAFREGLTSADEAFERFYCAWAWLPTSTLAARRSVFQDVRYPRARRSDGDSTLHAQLAALGASVAAIPETLAYIRRDAGYAFMSRSYDDVLVGRRETLRVIRAWLRERGIDRFDGLHRRAWSNHWLREARHHGGLRGAGLRLRAWLGDPSLEP